MIKGHAQSLAQLSQSAAWAMDLYQVCAYNSFTSCHIGMKLQLELSDLFSIDKNNRMVIYNDRQLSFIIKLEC